jgi:ketol-acid reductoisomerase
VPLLKDFMAKVDTDVIGKGLSVKDNSVDNSTLVAVNAAIRGHLIEEVGEELRAAMQGMKAIV